MKIAVLVFAALVLSSCSTYDAVRFLADSARPAPEPESPQPAASKPSNRSAGLDAAAKAEWNRYANPTASGKTFPAGLDLTNAASSTLQGGEWAVYRSLEGGQVKSVIKMAMVGKAADAWIYEFVSYTDKEVNVMQEAVKGMEDVVRTGNSDKAEIVWVKVRDSEGKVEMLTGATLGLMGNSYKSVLGANAARNPGAAVSGGSVTVPAGTFAATWKTESRVSRGASSEAGSAWVSTVVPLWHMVKAVSDNGKTVMELVDFGTSGYKSMLP
jgi:hypothetical protein